MSGSIILTQNDRVLRHLEHWAKAIGIDAILSSVLGGTIFKDAERRKGSLIEYYFIRTLDRKTKKKILLRINMRLIGQTKYTSIERQDAEAQGVSLEDILERLIDAHATKVRP